MVFKLLYLLFFPNSQVTDTVCYVIDTPLQQAGIQRYL